jgi:hypothetical protein
MIALRAAVLLATLAISTFVRFLQGLANEMLQKRQKNYANNKYLF